MTQTNGNINRLRADVDKYLDRYSISKAISCVKAMLQESRQTDLLSKLDAIAETYSFLTHYLLEGYQDPGRQKVIESICENLRTLADSALLAVMAIDSPDYYYSTYRFIKLRRERIADLVTAYGRISSELSLTDAAGDEDLALRKEKEDCLNRLFNTLFTSLGADQDYKDLTKYLISGYADETVAAQALSAMTLALLLFYDGGKIKSLIEIYENAGNDRIKARALVGIIMAMIPNSKRIFKDSEMLSRLSLMLDSEDTRHNILEVVKAIVGSRDTDRVTHKLKDEVIPELMKLRPDMLKSLNEFSMDPETLLENNPEWEDILKKSGLESKMRELSDMQSEGADLMMVTFSNLKQFPFFNQASNWFLPFDPSHSAVNLDNDMRSLIKMLTNTGSLICDSDLYSLALASHHMPVNQMSMLSKQLKANLDQLSEEARTSIKSSCAPKIDEEIVKVVRDLYRFFKLFRKREDFNDPFKKPLRFLELPVFGTALAEPEILNLIAEFYFKRKYYSDAEPLFEKLHSLDPADTAVIEKLGFCKQMDGNWQGAFECYSNASLLKTPGPWLTKKMAYVCKMLGMHDKAAELYRSALDMDPENVKLMLNTGSALLESGQIADALIHLYHANYVAPDAKIMRAIAWAELLNGNYEKSSDYSRRVISDSPIAADYLNAGHAAYMSGMNREALNFYRLAMEKDPDQFQKAFLADALIMEELPDYDKTTHLLLLDLTKS